MKFIYLDPVPDYVKATLETVIKISTHEPAGDVLVFLTGYEEVETVVKLLKDFVNHGAYTGDRGFTISYFVCDT